MQFLHRRRCCRGFRYDDQMPTDRNQRQGVPDQLSQATAHPVTNNCSTHTTRRDDPHSRWALIGQLEASDPHQTGLDRTAMLANTSKITAPVKANGFRKRIANRLRLRCVWRSGFRHLSGAGACARGGGGGLKWPGRPWSSCVRGIRTAACACAWKAGMCVS